MMINSEHNVNGVGSGRTSALTQDKQLATVVKKTALRDVQNENVGSNHKQQESLLTGGVKESLLPGGVKSSGDTIKVCGTKRLTPERPSSSQGLPSFIYNGTNENVMNARRRFELELGRGRLQNNVEKFSDYSESKNTGQLQQENAKKITRTRDGNGHSIPVTMSNNLTATTAFSSGSLSVPSAVGKPSSYSTPIAMVSPEFPCTLDSKSTKDLLRTERFICLQKLLKQCDEGNQREYTQMLLHLSPAELSKHAVELEKRAIQLTIEEGNEMQRMKALNILAKSPPANNVLQPVQLLQTNKR